MDEATSALDYETERKVATSFLTTSRTALSSSITAVDHSPGRHDVLLHEGVVVEVGTHDELMSRRGAITPYRQQRVPDDDESSKVGGFPSRAGAS